MTTARMAGLLGVALFLWGCPDADKPATKNATPPAKTRKKTAASRPSKTKAAPPATTKKKAAVVVPARKAELKATVKAPGYNGFVRALKPRRPPRPRAHSRGMVLGGTRFAAPVTTLKDGKSLLHLAVVDRQADGSWKLEQLLKVGEGPVGDGEMCPERVAVSAWAKDYDHDNKPEILLRYRTCKIERAIGETTKTLMFVFNAEGRLKLAYRTVLSEHFGSTIDTRGKARFKDVSGDGHPDIVTKSRVAEPGDDPAAEPTYKYETTQAIWVAATDSWSG